MGSVKTLNPNAEVMGRSAALFMNINAAKGLYEVMKTNFGPKGTIKMLVGGAGGEREGEERDRKGVEGREHVDAIDDEDRQAQDGTRREHGGGRNARASAPSRVRRQPLLP